jgi:CubicO group peptidase (beta-lactamase class C family)
MNSTITDRRNSELFQKLVDHARESMGHYHVPGVALGLLLDGQIFVTGLGVTNLADPLPVTPETVFQIASITKTFTATGVFRLIEFGKVSLDDPVRKYILDFQVQDEEAAARATIRNLLNHTGGWLGDFFVHTGEGDDALALYVKKMADLPQLTPLGAFYAYNNASFNVAGRVIEVIMDRPYEQAIRELVIDPLDLDQTFFFPAEVEKDRLAIGHYLKGDQVTPAHPWPVDRGSAPCGGLGSNVNDLLRYAQFHIGDGTTSQGVRLLTHGSLDQMQIPSISADDDLRMGLNWFIRDIDGIHLIGHSGSTDGHNSTLWMAPERKMALAVLTNLDPGSFLCDDLKNWVLEHCLGIVQHERVPLKVTSDQLKEYVGRYVTPPTGDLCELLLAEGSLLLKQTPGDYSTVGYPPPDAVPPAHIILYAPDRFILTEGPSKGRTVEFLREETGQIAWLRLDGRIAIRRL